MSGFPERERGLTSWEVRETPGEVQGTSAEVWETSRVAIAGSPDRAWEPVDPVVADPVRQDNDKRNNIQIYTKFLIK